MNATCVPSINLARFLSQPGMAENKQNTVPASISQEYSIYWFHGETKNLEGDFQKFQPFWENCRSD